MGFLSKLFGINENESSRQKAVDRLKLVLIHDRTDISPELLDNLREEIIDVLAKYMDIDMKKIEIDIDHDEKAFVANIPIINVKRGSVAV